MENVERQERILMEESNFVDQERGNHDGFNKNNFENDVFSKVKSDIRFLIFHFI